MTGGVDCRAGLPTFCPLDAPFPSHGRRARRPYNGSATKTLRISVPGFSLPVPAFEMW